MLHSMFLKPQQDPLTDEDVQRGLRMVIFDGLATETMVSLTGGAFLVALALLLGASNIQIGLLAALPMLANLFQILSVVLVQRYQNRRAIAVYGVVLGRIPLVVLGALIFLNPDTSVSTFIFFLLIHHLFSSIAGLSWNSWMKDMIPERILGSYFSRRSSYTQTLNVVLSVLLAISLDYIRSRHPEYELPAFALFFVVGSVVGLIGTYLLSRAPEPQSYMSTDRLATLFRSPLKNENFRRLLVFNSAWVFALHIATPFFMVFMLQGLGLPLSYVIVLTVLGQLSSIATLRMWGVLSDRYSNKSIIAVSGPLYVACIIGWVFVGIYSASYLNLGLLVLIHIFSGIATAGINLSLTNIGLKLAPHADAIVYLSVRNIVTSAFSALGPLVGGLLADYFAERSLAITFEWHSPGVDRIIKLVSLHQWNFLFLIGAVLALFSLRLLSGVKETGEVEAGVMRRIMRTRFRSSMKDAVFVGSLITWNNQLRAILKLRKRANPPKP